MDFAQVRAVVEKECNYLADESSIKIYVGFPPANPVGEHLLNLLRNEIKNNNLTARIIRTGSFGCYDFEPILVVDTPDRSVLLCLKANPEIVKNMKTGTFAAGMTERGGEWYTLRREKREHIPNISTLPMFNLQNRIVLRNCGWIDPGDTGHYIAGGNGFTGLARALQVERRELMKTLSSLHLHGYARPGSSSLDQWNECMESGSADKCLICNAIDSFPGGRSTLLLLESDPHAILEGMLISAYAVGALRCIIYVYAGNGSASNLRKLLDKMQKYGLAGQGILDSSFSAHIEVKEVSGTLREGQEAESLRCMGQNRASHIIPMYPDAEGTLSGPVIITNPEMMAYISTVFLTDEEIQTGFRIHKRGETRVISLSGDIAHTATAEIPCGVSLRNAIEHIGGGVAGGRSFKALQLSHPAGSLLGSDALDSCIHCRTSGEACSGSASLEIIDGDADIVNMARIRMENVNSQSCGKCLLCFEGSRQMFNVLERITGGNGKLQDMEYIKELATEMKTACLCAFGRTAPDFVLSSIELFNREYEERIHASL